MKKFPPDHGSSCSHVWCRKTLTHRRGGCHPAGRSPMPVGGVGQSMVDTRDIAEVATIGLLRRERASVPLQRETIDLVGPDVLTAASIASHWFSALAWSQRQAPPTGSAHGSDGHCAPTRPLLLKPPNSGCSTRPEAHTGEFVVLAQRLGATRAKYAPCGSVACTIQLPPGTSCGPCTIWPPPAFTRSLAASMASTLK